MSRHDVPTDWHTTEYAIEAWGLATFMISASLFGTLIFHPASPVHATLPLPIAQRAVMGVLMGLTSYIISRSAWGQRSGAHLNPALTLSFLRLGKIAPRDAAMYVVAQFAGGVVGMTVSAAIMGEPLSHPNVHYVVTAPGVTGIAAAFISEATISAIMISTVLHSAASARWSRHTALLAASLVFLFITFENPLSGMSMNPARSFGSAAVAMDWRSLWVYFTAPLAGMLAGAEYFRRRGVTQHASGTCGAKIVHGQPCIFCDYIARKGEVPASNAQPLGASHRSPTLGT